MAKQIPVDRGAAVAAGAGALTLARPDVASLRLGIVNVVLLGAEKAGDRGWTLVDAGLRGTADTIAKAADRRFGTGARPAAIVMTHGHFDHVGALTTLAERWDAPVYAHRLELPYLDGRAKYPPGDPTVGGGAMALLARLYPRGPTDVRARLAALPDDGTVPTLPGWRWIHTPGHSVGHISLWRESDRTLVAGDAVVTTGQESAIAVMRQETELHGPPTYYTVDWPLARESVRSLAALDPETLLTGHGRPLRGAAMRAALGRLGAEFDAVALPSRGRYLGHPARAADGSAYR